MGVSKVDNLIQGSSYDVENPMNPQDVADTFEINPVHCQVKVRKGTLAT